MIFIQATLATLLLIEASSAPATSSELADLPAKIREQLSPRLLYSKKSGVQPCDKDPAACARHLLQKMQLDHLNFDIIRAVHLPTVGLLFEMNSYEQANEVATAWTRILRHPAAYGLADTCPRRAFTCVSNDFELKQTERDFYVGPSSFPNNFGGPTYRMGGGGAD